MDVCVRRMGDLVPVWLSMLEMSILSLRTGLRDISPGPNLSYNHSTVVCGNDLA
jgi:hypothetical protein